MSEVYIDGIRYIPERKVTKKKKPLWQLLIEARELRGETLDYVADMTGTTKSNIWSLEAGETTPRLPMLQKLLKYYGISFEEIEDET